MVQYGKMNEKIEIKMYIRLKYSWNTFPSYKKKKKLPNSVFQLSDHQPFFRVGKIKAENVNDKQK